MNIIVSRDIIVTTFVTVCAISIVQVSTKPTAQGLEDAAVVIVNSNPGEDGIGSLEEGRHFFPIDETPEDVAGFRLPRLIESEGAEKDLETGTTFAIVIDSNSGGRQLQGGGGSSLVTPSFPQDHSAPDKAGFRLPRPQPEEGRQFGLEAGVTPFPQDHSAPNKAGFRLPRPQPEEDQEGRQIDLEVLIVEAPAEKDDVPDAVVVVGGGAGPEVSEEVGGSDENDYDDIVVISAAADEADDTVDDNIKEYDDIVIVSAPSGDQEEESADLVAGNDEEEDVNDYDDIVIISSNSREPKQLNSEVVDCTLPPEVGLCYSQIGMYYYDSKQDKCVHFLYSGCGGNTNRFSTEAACQDQCQSGGRSSNVGAASPERVPRIEFDSSICSEPGGRSGICKGSFQYWFFNQNTFECQPFIFGGCEAGSTPNKFRSRELCQQTCVEGSRR